MIRSARKFAADLGRDGVGWEAEVGERVRGGLARAGIELTDGEHLDLFTAWHAAYPFAEEEPT